MSGTEPLGYKIELRDAEKKKKDCLNKRFILELSFGASLSTESIPGMGKAITSALEGRPQQQRYSSYSSSYSEPRYWKYHKSECHFLIRDFDQLNATQQAAVMEQIYQGLLGDKTKLTDLIDPRSLVLEFASGDDKRAEESAARACWIQLHSKESDKKQDLVELDFPPVLADWLEENSKEGRLLYNPPPREAWQVYRLSMGSLFLKELLGYASKNPQLLRFNELIYRVGEPESTFLNDLQALKEKVGLPLKLNLKPKFSTDFQKGAFLSATLYSDAQFTALMDLLKASTEHPNGIVEINFSKSNKSIGSNAVMVVLQCFSQKQLEQLLIFVNECNEQHKPLCQLKGIYDDPALIAKLRDTKNLHLDLRQQIARACEKNYRIIQKKRVLTLLQGQASAVSVSALERKVAEPSPVITEIKSHLEQKDREAKKGLLKDFVERVTRQGARVHVQEQQQQQQQQQEQQQQHQQEQRQDVNQGLQTLDEKDVIRFPKWKADYCKSGYYKDNFTGLQHKLVVDDAKRERFLASRKRPEEVGIDLWFGWTLSGLELAQNLQGFTPSAMAKILEHVTLFRDGFDFDALPQGLVVRRFQVGDQVERILCYDPSLPPPTNPLAPRLKQAASRIPRDQQKIDWHTSLKEQKRILRSRLKTDEAKLAPYLDKNSKDEQPLAQLINQGYCYKDTSDGNHGVCNCVGCTNTPEQKEKKGDERVAQVFSSKKQLRAALTQEVRDFGDRLQNLSRHKAFDQTRSAYDYDPYDGIDFEALNKAFYGEALSWGEHIQGRGEALALHEKAWSIRRKWLAKLFNRIKMDDQLDRPDPGFNLQLPEEGEPWTKNTFAQSKTDVYNLKGFKYFSLYKPYTSACLELSDEIVEGIWAEWQAATREYNDSLKNQRAAFYKALWPGEEVDAVETSFPVLRRFSLRHLAMLLEIAEKLDLEPRDEKSTDLLGAKQKKAVHALLEKFTTINKLDNSLQTFNTLLKTVLNPSDSWLNSLVIDDDALLALDGICQLNPAERTNWNWLLNRHGESCGYADLGHLWRSFEYFNQEYKKLCPGQPPLDFTKFPVDSVKNMDLLLDFTLVILRNSRDKNEQVALLSGGKIKIDPFAAYHASRHQGYYLVSEEMELDVPPSAKQAARAKISGERSGGSAGTSIVVDYRVSRSALLAKAPKPRDVYRYSGQQSHAALSLSDYRKCQQDCKAAKDQVDPRWLILVITTAHQRAAESFDTDAILKWWPEFVKETKPDNDLLQTLMTWHQDTDFPPLTFIEAVTLLRLWQATPQEKYKDVVNQTKAILGDPLYRQGFLRVLREVYAKGHYLLGLSDYLEHFNALKAVFDDEKSIPAKKALSDLPSDLPQVQWCESLCWFISRIGAAKAGGVKEEEKQEEKEESAVTPPTIWQDIVAKLKHLHQQQTQEGHSVARRLIVMLSGLSPAALSMTQLDQLLQKAITLSSTSEGTEPKPISDTDLFSWLKKQAKAFQSLGYTPLRPRVEHPPIVQESITDLLQEYPSLGLDQKEQLKKMLTRLWDPKGSLSDLKEEWLASANKAIKDRARLFLKVLLNPQAVWRKRSHLLIQLLAEHPQLESYDFGFLEQLLRSIGSTESIDSELSLFKALLSVQVENPRQIQQLLDKKESFSEAIKAVCELKNISSDQRVRMLSLLRAYASNALTIEALLSLFKTFAESYSLATNNNMLLMLDHALKTGDWDVLHNTAKSLEVLGTKDKKLISSLLYGLDRDSLDAQSRAAILQQCTHEKTSQAVLQVFAMSLGRKDSGEDIQNFLILLIKLETEQPDQFKSLQTLCQHPPKFGIQKLRVALTNGQGQLLAVEKLVENLRKLEIDPYFEIAEAKEAQSQTKSTIKPRDQQEPYCAEQVAKKMSEVNNPGRHADGEPRRLFASQQQALEGMVKRIRQLGGDLKEEKQVLEFKNTDGEKVSASQLTQAELAEFIKVYRESLSKPDISDADKQETLLKAIALMREAMYRSTGNFADDTQIAVVSNAMVRQTHGKRFLQIDTGQGKTLINAFNAACMWLLRGEAMVLTSDSNLARRDLELNREFFEYLKISVADSTIEQTSAETTYCQGGINYSTFAGFDLWVDKRKLEGCTWISRLLRKSASASVSELQPGLIVDEVDDAFFACNNIDYRYSIPQLQIDSEDETPLAIFYEAMANDFLNTKHYQALLKKEGAITLEAFDCLREFLFKLPYPYHPTPEQYQQLRSLLEKNPKQLRAWLASLHRCEKMRQGIDFTVATVDVVVDGESRKIKRVCPYSSSGRPSNMQFADGLQQFLQAKQKKTDPAFFIQQESDTLLWGNNYSIFNQFRDIVGVTGTVGSAQLVRSRLRRWGFSVHTMPPHQDRQRSEGPVQYCDDDNAYEAAIKDKISDYLKDGNDDPILLIAWNAEQLKQIERCVKEVLETSEFKARGITSRMLDGEQTHQQEKEVVKSAGHKKSVTLTTRLGGRGFDVITDDKTVLRELRCSPPPTEAESEQWSGRVSRRGKKGTVDTIVKKSDMVARSGLKIEAEAKATTEDTLNLHPLKQLWAENEAWDNHQWELISEFGYIRDELITRFLTLYGAVHDLRNDDLTERCKFAQINFLKGLETVWETIKQTENLQALWLQGDKSKYYLALEVARQTFQAEAARAWNEMLEEFGAELDKFGQRQQPVKQAQAEQPGASEEAKVAEPASIKNLLAQLKITAEGLAAVIPKKQLPYFDLPTAADADALEAKESAKFDTIAGEKDIPALTLSHEAIYQALRGLVKTCYIDAQTPVDEATAAITAFLSRDYSDLGLQQVNINIGKEEQHRRIKRGMPSQTANIIYYGLRLVSIDYSWETQTYKCYLYLDWNTGSVLKPDTISTWSNEVLAAEKQEKERQKQEAEARVQEEKQRQEEERQKQKEEKQKQEAEARVQEEKQRQEAERQKQKEEKQRQEAEKQEQEQRRKQEEKPKTETSVNESIDLVSRVIPVATAEQSYEKWYWLLFALSCMGSGCGLIFLGPTQWVTVMLGIVSLSSTVSLPVLAAIGLGYGFAAFLAIFVLAKITQAIMASIRQSDPDKKTLEIPGSSKSNAVSITLLPPGRRDKVPLDTDDLSDGVDHETNSSRSVNSKK